MARKNRSKPKAKKRVKGKVKLTQRARIVEKNEDNKISFAYIAGKIHGRLDITPEQFNQVIKILYG